MISRRQLLIAGAAGGAALLSPRGAWAAPMRLAQPLLDPTIIPKYVTDLVIPPAMPPARKHGKHKIDEYLIGVRQFPQQVLPPGLPRTTVWGYGSAVHKGTFNFPAFTIDARVDRPVRVTWINQLVDKHGRFLPHLLPVDPTLHWANPPGGTAGRDSTPTFTSTPGPYTGPVPMVVHLHGGHSREESDGYPEAWYLPDGAATSRRLRDGGQLLQRVPGEVRAAARDRAGSPAPPPSSTTTTSGPPPMWFHDHALGHDPAQTSTPARPASTCCAAARPTCHPGVLPGPAPAARRPARHPLLRDPHRHPGPVVQPGRLAVLPRQPGVLRRLHHRGRLHPERRRAADLEPRVLRATPWWSTAIPGRRSRSSQRRYRLRLLNGCNARFLILKIAANPTDPRPVAPALPIWLIGTDGGFLPEPVRLDQILLGTPSGRT